MGATSASSSYMYLDEDATLTRPCVLYEVDVLQDFELKRRIYENRELFYGSDGNEVEADDSDIKEIETGVVRGKAILLDNLKGRSDLDIEIAETKKRYSSIDTACDDLCAILAGITRSAADCKMFDATIMDAASKTLTGIQELRQGLLKSLCDKSKSAEEEINKKDTIIRKLGRVYGILKSASLGYLCPVCLSRNVNVFCDPCGHTFCNDCMKADYCYLCRAKVKTTRKLFMSSC